MCKFINIKKFSQDLLDKLQKLNNWPEKVKLMQKNWIGKSYGCEINFKIDKINKFKKIKVFTTRPDTIFGASFIAISIDHPIAKKPVLKPIFSAFANASSVVPVLEHSDLNVIKFLFFSKCFANGWSKESAMKEAPNIVSGLVVNTFIFLNFLLL